MSSERLIELEKKIEVIREKMMNTASEQGFTSNESLQLSQKLDELIGEYLHLKMN